MASVGKFKRFWKVKKQNLALSAHLRCEGGEDQYLSLDSDATRLFRWKRLAGELVTPDCNLELAEVYVEGPDAGVDLYVDALNVRPRVLVPNSEGFGPNIVTNSDFEVDASGWFGFGDPTVEVSDLKSNSGLQSGYASGRTASWQGPATSLLADVVPGASYQLLAWVSLEEGSAQVRASIKASCPEGDQYFGVGGTNANDLGWSVVAGLFTVPDCDLSELTLYFEGSDAGINIFIDDVFVRQEIVEGEPNLISNADFESGINGWTAWGGVLSATTEQAHSGSQSALLSERTGTWQGPVYNLLPTVAAGDEVSVSAWGRIAGAASDTMNITIKTTCAEDGDAYHQLASVAVSDSDWTELSGSLVLPECTLTDVSLYFDGPAIGVDVYLDDVVATGGTPVDPDNLVANPDFESGVNGWVAWGDASLEASADRSHSGAQSARLYNRTATWQGPVYNLLSAVEAGATYDISAWTVLDGSATETVSITIKTTCEIEGEAYNQAGSVVANDVDWTQVEGTITLPDCVLTEVSMYFDGPAAGVDTYLDDVSVKLAE